MHNLERMKERNAGFQMTVDSEYLRKRIDDSQFELRKYRRNLYNSRKRAILSQQSGKLQATSNRFFSEGIEFSIAFLPPSLYEQYPALFDPSLSPHNRYESLITLLGHSRHLEVSDLLATALNRILQSSSLPNLGSLVEKNVIPNLLDLLTSENQEYKEVSVSCLINISSVVDDERLSSNFVVNKIIGLLQDSDEDFRHNCVWLLGNIAPNVGDSTVRIQAIGKILSGLNTELSVESSKMRIWAVQNLLYISFSLFSDITDLLVMSIQRLIEIEDDELQSTCLSVLAIIAKQVPICRTDLVNRAFNWLDCKSGLVLVPALTLISNIVQRDEDDLEDLLKMNLLDKLQNLLIVSSSNVQQQVFYILSNITASREDQTERALKHGIMKQVLSAAFESKLVLKTEVVWVLANLTLHKRLMPKLYEIGGVQAICDLLKEGDKGILLIALQAVNNVLAVAKVEGADFFNKFEEMGGLDALQRLQYHRNMSVYNLAVRVLKENYDVSQESLQTETPEIFDISQLIFVVRNFTLYERMCLINIFEYIYFLNAIY